MVGQNSYIAKNGRANRIICYMCTVGKKRPKPSHHTPQGPKEQKTPCVGLNKIQAPATLCRILQTGKTEKTGEKKEQIGPR